jgi:LacI family transcriptional regulator
VATVSYVINNGPRPVSPATRRRVEEAISSLGYFPNELARSLRLQQSSTIGLIIPNSANPFWAEIAREIEWICTRAGFLLLLCNSDRIHERELRAVQMLRAKAVDGVILAPHGDVDALLRPLRAAGTPVVLLEQSVPGVDCVVIDDLAGGLLATRHLLGLGHRRIAMIRRRQTTATSMLRIEGYRQALAEAGLPFDAELVIAGGPLQHDGYQAMQALLALDRPPTALFTHNDVVAMGALRAAYDGGLRVPDDLSVVGYDDITAAAYLAPPLTTVRSPKADMGMWAGDTITHLALGSWTALPATRTLPVELVIRGSTGPGPYAARGDALAAGLAPAVAAPVLPAQVAPTSR